MSGYDPACTCEHCVSVRNDRMHRRNGFDGLFATVRALARLAR